MAGLFFFGLLLLAFSLDVVTRFTGLPVTTLVAVFRGLVLGLPLLAGLCTFVLARALRDSDAERFTALPLSDVRQSLRRRPHRPRRPAPPPADLVPAEHLPVEPGAVP